MTELATLQTEGVERMLKRLGDAERKEFVKAAKKATRTGLKPTLAAARAAAPVRTGRLRKAIKLRVWRRPKRGEVGHKVFIDPGKTRDDPKGAYYGAMIESGYIANGEYVPGRHMVGNAHARHAAAAQAELAEALIDEAIRIARIG